MLFFVMLCIKLLCIIVLFLFGAVVVWLQKVPSVLFFISKK